MTIKKIHVAIVDLPMVAVSASRPTLTELLARSREAARLLDSASDYVSAGKERRWRIAVERSKDEHIAEDVRAKYVNEASDLARDPGVLRLVKARKVLTAGLKALEKAASQSDDVQVRRLVDAIEAENNKLNEIVTQGKMTSDDLAEINEAHERISKAQDELAELLDSKD